MFQIKVSKKAKELHEKYYKNKIIDNLKNSKIKFVHKDIIKINSKLKKRYYQNYIQSQHNKFIKYCINNYKRISIGEIGELQKIEEEINKKYPIIVKLIRENIIFSNKNVKYPSEKYSTVLLKLFGYADFDSCDFYNLIYNQVKENVSVSQISPKNYSYVENEMKNVLKKLFPRITIAINECFCEEYESYDKIKSYADKLKEKFMKLEKEYSLGLTIDSYDSNIFKNTWNSYIFVFSSGLRTCPYCNRQYITPILTSDGRTKGTLDHFLAKDQFPYFSMSLYNLVPACSSCNSSLKGTKEFGFNNLSPYEGNLDDYVKFHADIRKKDIYINIIKTDKLNKKTKIKKKNVEKLLDTFKLKLQYNYHVSQVQELILKRVIYSEKYIDDIKNSKFSKNGISKSQIKETIIGYSSNQASINNEPLSKFRRDIVEQLDFFNDSNDKLIEQLKEVIKNRY